MVDITAKRFAVLSILITLLFMSHTSAASTTEANLDDAWRAYVNSQTHLPPVYRFPHASCFGAAALQYDLPLTLLLAVARGESDFEETARSRANAHGVMQILWPDTAKHLGIDRLSELYDPCVNIDAGARYLKELVNQYSGNLHLALAAYNYGPRRIPASGENIPTGANWYSGYIYRHLNYVLGSSSGTKPIGDALYSELGQSTLVSFGEPYRATAFIAQLERNAPELNLDWFRRGTGKFEVVMTYADRQEFDRGAGLLRRAGFRVD
ncbi:MAG: lytic transglycosylase domain-containing protein [Gammaproteobacteria bacterium]|nr:lytic transglycosylase domain-containing protein [Gammaproteobacteria bacterium]MDH3750044.1 lytic transglycosylase domain-containing protein [Gammaproteobacteria bacterium]MDH3804113.1 lytic transglycosylase domain-containing protein [Gammaproteobacteria bacterium]